MIIITGHGYNHYNNNVTCSHIQCRVVIDSSLSVARDLYGDVDLRVLMHDQYGKGFIKRCNISPDAFIQMALQLAYYRVSLIKFYLCLSKSIQVSKAVFAHVPVIQHLVELSLLFDTPQVFDFLTVDSDAALLPSWFNW